MSDRKPEFDSGRSWLDKIMDVVVAAVFFVAFILVAMCIVAGVTRLTGHH